MYSNIHSFIVVVGDVEQQLIVVVGSPTSAEFEFPALILTSSESQVKSVLS